MNEDHDIIVTYDKHSDLIEIDTGHQYLSLSLKDAQSLQSELNRIVDGITYYDFKLNGIF